jgi:hypothetical protein
MRRPQQCQSFVGYRWTINRDPHQRQNHASRIRIINPNEITLYSQHPHGTGQNSHPVQASKGRCLRGRIYAAKTAIREGKRND